MSSKDGSSRRAGFSLMEVIIATAILAASALVLSSLLGLGTKFGNRAELRSFALVKAQSVLDEYLASRASNGAGDPGNSQPGDSNLGAAPTAAMGLSSAAERTPAEWSGELAGQPALSFRLTVRPDTAQMRPEWAAALEIVTVQIFESSAAEGGPAPAKASNLPVCELSQWVRKPPRTFEKKQFSAGDGSANSGGWPQ